LEYSFEMYFVNVTTDKAIKAPINFVTLNKTSSSMSRLLIADNSTAKENLLDRNLTYNLKEKLGKLGS
jgi:hypothetical protein